MIRSNQVIGVIVLSMVLAMTARPADAASDLSDKVKAAFLFNFAKFVAWPPEKRPERGESIRFCVAAGDDFVQLLERVVAGKEIEGASLSLIRMTDVDDLTECHLAYVAGDTAQMGESLTALLAANVLTVHESDDARPGGVIRFYLEDRRIRFEVNQRAAERAHLRFSAKLLHVARLVDA